MKRINKPLSLLLAAALLCCLLPTAAFAAAGTESDPIPLELGETVQHTPGEDVFYTFTPEEDGVYTVLMEATPGSLIEPADQPVPLADNGGRGLSGYLQKGETYKLKGLGNMAWVRVIDQGRLYSKMYDDEYLIWDFDPEKGTLTIDPGQGDGEMRPYAGDRHDFPWYYIEGQIKHVVIGEGVTSVSPHAFDTSSLFDSIEAFAALEDVSFPSTLKSIGEYAFYKCPSLKTVTFPAALEYIGDMAFFYCPHLRSVTFAGPTALSWDTFDGCTELEEVNVLDPNMRDFGIRPFFNSPWIRSVAAENKGAVVVNHVLIGAYQAWDKEKGDGILVIPDGVTKVAKCAVYGITTDPAGGEEGFQNNWYLEEIIIPDSVTDLSYDTFLGGPFSGCGNLERVTIGEGVTVIPPHCFEGCGELRTVNFGKNIRQICDYAFHDTWLPGDLEIPDSVISIGKQAFYNDEFPLGASWVPDTFGFFPDKVVRPKDFTDRYITIGANVKEIGDKAFWGWTLVSDDPLMPGGTATIKGYDSTCAQQWAEDNGFTFESLGAAPASSNPFVDVPASQYYYEPVLWAVGRGVTNGTSPTTFSPKNTCTRAQVVTFLWRAAGQPLPDAYINPFTDVKPTDYFYYAVLWAYHKDITRGSTATTFNPKGDCTRGQVVTFLWRAEDEPAVSGSASFSDVPAGQYYTDAVTWAVGRNITNGTGNNQFSPNSTCTRGQIVTFLYRDMT